MYFSAVAGSHDYRFIRKFIWVDEKAIIEENISTAFILSGKQK